MTVELILWPVGFVLGLYFLLHCLGCRWSTPMDKDPNPVEVFKDEFLE